MRFKKGDIIPQEIAERFQTNDNDCVFGIDVETDEIEKIIYPIYPIKNNEHMIILNNNYIWPKFKYKLQTQPKDFDLNAFLSVKGKYGMDMDSLVKELDENSCIK